MVDEHRVRTPLGLGALAGVVDQERVDEWQITKRGIGCASRRHAERLAGQPLEVAVLTEVHDRIGAKARVEPVVGGQVVMAGRQVGVVVDRHRVVSEPPRRLHHQHDVAGLDCGDNDFALRIAAAVNEQPSRRLPPVLQHPVLEFGWQRFEPLPVLGARHADRVALELACGQPVRVLSPALDECVHQRVTIAGVKARNLAEPVAALAHRLQ